MNKLHRLTSLCFVLLLSACAGITDHWSNPNEAVEQFLSQQQYSRAMEVIASVDQQHPDYEALQKKRKLILAEIKAFESDSIKLQNRYKSKQQWPQAIAIADSDIKKLPASQALIDYRQKLIIERRQYIENKQVQLAIGQANSLPGAIKLLEDIDSAIPDIKTQAQALLITRSQSNNAHSTLLSAAKKESDNKNWRTAKRYLVLANQLQADNEANELLASISQRIDREELKNSKSRQVKRQKTRNQKLEKLELALNDKNYLQARDISEQLQTWKKQDKTVAIALNNYQKTINKESNKLTAKGQKLYTKGYIDLAIESWKMALLLDPHNSDIQERLQRAKKFKANIDKYK
jgi:hypothetical protein